ncbi:hypothetical protein WJX74_004434 [Apatococcus lobatus]|uniref:C2HC/C3H-type domain-containing protein n=1 Tax=Apatococcus lobatus TaxID=904363 RepID=A0AAW1SBH5_9CHLO
MHLEPRAEHDSSLTLEPRLRDATNQPLAFAARQKTYKMQNLMRKGSLLATFTRRKRSTKEDMSSAWDQNESLPEEFQSLQDHYQQQQQQQQHEQQTTNSDGIKMPKLPGAPSQSSSGKIKQQFPGRSASRSRTKQTPSLFRLPSLQGPQAESGFSQSGRYQQAYSENDVLDNEDQWPHLNAVPYPMPGVWPNLNLNPTQKPHAMQPPDDFRTLPSYQYTTPLPPHANPLMDSYVQPDAYAGGTHEAWPLSACHQAQQPFPQARSNFSSQAEPAPYQTPATNGLDLGLSQGAGQGFFGQQDRLDPWTGLLQSSQQQAAGSPLRTTGSGINWGMDRDSLSLAASASQKAFSHGIAQRVSHAPSQLEGSAQMSRSTTRPAYRASQRCRSGGSSETPDGLPLGWGDSAAVPATAPQSGQSNTVQHRRTPSSTFTGGQSRQQQQQQQHRPHAQPPQLESDWQIEAQRVQNGLTWAQQQVAGSRQHKSQATPRHASREQRYQGGHLQEVLEGGHGLLGDSPRSDTGIHLRQHNVPSDQSFGGLDASMGGESLLIAAGSQPARRQDSVSLQWQLPQQPPRHIPKQQQPPQQPPWQEPQQQHARGSSVVPSQSPINRSGLSRLKAARIQRRPLRSQTTSPGTTDSQPAENADPCRTAAPPAESNTSSRPGKLLKEASFTQDNTSRTHSPNRLFSKKASKPAWAGVLEESHHDQSKHLMGPHSESSQSDIQQQLAAAPEPREVRRQGSSMKAQTDTTTVSKQSASPPDAVSQAMSRRLGKAASLRHKRSLRPAWQDPTPPLEPHLEAQTPSLNDTEMQRGRVSSQKKAETRHTGNLDQLSLPHPGQQNTLPRRHAAADEQEGVESSSRQQSAAIRMTQQNTASAGNRGVSGPSSGSESSSGSETTSKGSDTTSTRVSSSEASPLPEVPSARNTPFVPKQPPHSKQRPQRVAMGMRQADVKDSGRGKENEHAPSLKDSQSAAVQDAYGSSASAMDGVAEQPTEPIHLQECWGCGRTFAPAALQRHASACKAVFQQKRNRFDAQAARLEGTEAKRTFTNARREEEEASFQRRPARRGQQTARSKADQDGAKLKAHPKWKQQSHMLRAAMAAARGDAPSGRTQGYIMEGGMEQVAPSDDLIPCPHCGRRYNEHAAERHIPRCQSIRAKPNVLRAGAGRGAYMRTQQQHSPSTPLQRTHSRY